MTQIIKCPFCLNHCVESKPGKTTCPGCTAEFEIDDRLECIFANTSKMMLPMDATVCSACGLVQGNENMNCVYCGAELRSNSQ